MSVGDVDIEKLIDAFGLGDFKSKAKLRGCHGCTACCTVEAVEGLGKPKPAFTPCPHLNKSSRPCSIYKRRPEPCRFYFCGWRLGVGPATLEPRASKVVIGFAPLASDADPDDMIQFREAQLSRVLAGKAPALSVLRACVSASAPYDPEPVYTAIGELYDRGLEAVGFTDAGNQSKLVATTPNKLIAFKWLDLHSVSARSPWNDDPQKWLEENMPEFANGILGKRRR